jgi:hypothetical protein
VAGAELLMQFQQLFGAIFTPRNFFTEVRYIALKGIVLD